MRVYWKAPPTNRTGLELIHCEADETLVTFIDRAKKLIEHRWPATAGLVKITCIRTFINEPDAAS